MFETIRARLLGGTTTPLQKTFDTVYEDRFNKLEVRAGTLGLREVRFTLKGGVANLHSAYQVLNTALSGTINRPSWGWGIYPSDNNDLPGGTSDIIQTFTPVIKDSNQRQREGDNPEHSHSAFLARLGSGFVNNDIFRLAAGAFRVHMGFPSSAGALGTLRDRGDLCEGKMIRTALGSGSRAVRTGDFGVEDVRWPGDRDKTLFVAGLSL